MDVITTIGPSSWDRATVAAHLRLGVRCIRFSFSKLEPGVHVERCRFVREVAAESGTTVLTMADLPGGKARLNTRGPLAVEPGRRYRIARQPSARDDADAWLEPGLADADVVAGDRVVIGDGDNRFTVLEASADYLTGIFAAKGVLDWQRSFTRPGKDGNVRSFTDRDKLFATRAREAAFDYVALSFVRSSDDVTSARTWLAQTLDWTPRIIAKVETGTAVANADAIARAADGVMVARGDLAVHVGCERLWAAQRTVIEACLRARTYCIVATGFLESMSEAATPSRAECIDLCAALESGADAIMFTAETAIGTAPVAVVETALRLTEAWRESRAATHAGR